MENLILIIHVIVSIAVIGLVLIQHGKGADAGAAFGGGNSGSVFGVQGSSNFLTRATSISVTLFFCTSIANFLDFTDVFFSIMVCAPHGSPSKGGPFDFTLIFHHFRRESSVK